MSKYIYRVVLGLSPYKVRDFASAGKMKKTLGLRTRGVTTSGLLGSTGFRLRPELQNQPEFEGLAGPMYGGFERGRPVVRYEAIEVFRALSSD